MGLDVYFRRDIANVLRATACASDGSARLALEIIGEPEDLTAQSDQEKLLQVYRQGVRHALVSVGLAFGLDLVVPRQRHNPGTSPHLAGLLWAEAPDEI